jgi:hypothetical protein
MRITIATISTVICANACLPYRQSGNYGKNEITGCRRREKCRVSVTENSRVTAGKKHTEQHDGDQQARDVQRAKHPPGQIRFFGRTLLTA